MRCAHCPAAGPRCGGECPGSRHVCDLAASTDPVHRAHAAFLAGLECGPEVEGVSPGPAIRLTAAAPPRATVAPPTEPVKITCLYLDGSRCWAGRAPFDDGEVWPQWCRLCLGESLVTDRRDEGSSDP